MVDLQPLLESQEAVEGRAQGRLEGPPCAGGKGGVKGVPLKTGEQGVWEYGTGRGPYGLRAAGRGQWELAGAYHRPRSGHPLSPRPRQLGPAPPGCPG